MFVQRWAFSCVLGKLITFAGSIPKEFGHLSILEKVYTWGDKPTSNGVELTCVLSLIYLRALQFKCRKGEI